MCKKQNAVSQSSTRIWNHLSGHWTEIGWVACSGTMGSNRFCSWEYFSCFRSIGANLRVMITNVISLIRKSMWWKDFDAVPSNVQSARQEALLYVFEDNEALIKMIIKGRSPTMKHVFQDPQSCSWLAVSIELIWTPKSKSNTSTPKTNSQTSWPKGISHVMSGIICWACLTLTISVLQLALLQWQNESSTGIRRRTCHSQIETYDECNSENAFGRVVFNFIKPGEDLVWISRSWEICCGRRSIRETWEKTSWDMMQQVRPHHEEPLLDGNAHSVRYGEMIHDGSGKPEKVNSQEGADSKTFVVGSDAAEFVNKVKDQVRSRQKRM